MSTINNLLERFKALDTDKVAVEAVSDTKDNITAYNKQQMYKGINAKGDQIGMYRSKQYAVYKNYLNPLPGYGIPDLFVTGAFYNGIKTDVSGQSITIDSTDGKSADLEGKYKNIFGLSTDYKVQYISNNLKPALQTKIENVLQLKFK